MVSEPVAGVPAVTEAWSYQEIVKASFSFMPKDCPLLLYKELRVVDSLPGSFTVFVSGILASSTGCNILWLYVIEPFASASESKFLAKITSVVSFAGACWLIGICKLPMAVPAGKFPKESAILP